jgi:hypothetical protein
MAQPPLPAPAAPASDRPDVVVGQDVKDNALWEQALSMLKAAQDCLRTLQQKGILRMDDKPSK